MRLIVLVFITSLAALAQCPTAAVNAASYAEADLVPGEVITIFVTGLGPIPLTTFQGQIPTTLAGLEVLFDGVPAPLLYVSTAQIAAIVPFSEAGKNGAQIQVVTVQGAPPTCNAQPSFVPSAPGIFTADSSGLDQAAAFNLDGSINGPTHPAAPGSVVSFYITGAGQTNPPLTDGMIATGPANLILPVTATIGGQPAQVMYAGAAPGIVAGVYQVNAVVPAGLPNGGPLPLTVQVGGVAAQTGVTITVAGPAPPMPRSPQPGDLRFQGVDAAPHLMLNPACGDQEFCELHGAPQYVYFSNAVSSFLMPFNGEWRFQVVEPYAGESVPFGLTFQSDFLGNLLTQIDSWSASPTIVITSLDLNPTNQTFAWSTMASQGPFQVHFLSVAPSALQTTASSEGAASRVITALSYDGTGNVSALSYGWQTDTQTVYESKVAITSDPADVVTAAMSLASSGYIITAFGNGGQLMVGTKVKGDTVPRPLAIALDPAEMLREGYTVVGYFNGAFTSPCYILQK
jgi:uncharacterized protein (TIGR03437 family)